MAIVKSAAILTRIREVLEDSRGTIRTIPSARFLGDLPEGLDEETQRIRAIEKPRVEASIRRMTTSASSPPVLGNLIIYEIDVEVRIIRLIEPIAQLDDDTRVALQALALDDADYVAQALGFPGNLTSTQAGTATDLASGLLRYQSTDEIVVGRIDDGAQTLETIHRFAGHAISRPAVS